MLRDVCATEERSCRLHQILEPFMLRRQVQDVEGSLPEKVTITIKCPMTPYQAAIYNWVHATALLRIDPASEAAQRMGSAVRSLKNKVMELRKARHRTLVPAQLPTRCAALQHRNRSAVICTMLQSTAILQCSSNAAVCVKQHRVAVGRVQACSAVTCMLCLQPPDYMRCSTVPVFHLKLSPACRCATTHC